LAPEEAGPPAVEEAATAEQEMASISALNLVVTKASTGGRKTHRSSITPHLQTLIVAFFCVLALGILLGFG
jgi:hypothetical protein